MANFFAELKRRHIYRVAAAYAVVAWVLLQLFNNVAPILESPPWVARTVLLLLVLGFPVALIFAWMRELAPADGGTVRAATGKLDWALIGGLVIVIALLSYQQLAPSKGTITAQEQGVDSARKAAATPATAISLAVLPFTNLSGDPSQEFFSDGMTEEITSALAKVPNLRVVARTSSFEFKGQNRDMRAVGQALGVTHLIEGSVRKDGNQVRITAQLIKADDGTHLWTEDYDRQLTGIFAVQEDIAKAIAGALRVPLGLTGGKRLVANRTNDVETYDQFLRAKALIRARSLGLKPLNDAIALLEPVVARDPNYAPAWAQLALAYGTMPMFHPAMMNGPAADARQIVTTSLAKAESAANRALQLDPDLPQAYLGAAYVQYVQQRFVAADDLFAKALALDANDPDVLGGFAVLLSDVGRVKESLAIRRKILALEPFVPLFNFSLAQDLWLVGQDEEAIAILKAAAPDQLTAPFYLARIYASQGRYTEAADLVLRSPGFRPETLEKAARVLRSAPASPPDLSNLGYYNWVYNFAGNPEKVLESFETLLDGSGYLVISGPSAYWHASYGPVRKLGRFKTVMRKSGFVDYWKARGWPDLCRPQGATDFVCD